MGLMPALVESSVGACPIVEMEGTEGQSSMSESVKLSLLVLILEEDDQLSAAAGLSGGSFDTINPTV